MKGQKVYRKKLRKSKINVRNFLEKKRKFQFQKKFRSCFFLEHFWEKSKNFRVFWQIFSLNGAAVRQWRSDLFCLTSRFMLMAVGCFCAFSFIGSMAVAPSHCRPHFSRIVSNTWTVITVITNLNKIKQKGEN